MDVKRTLGVCYYPEHWDPSMWEPDVKRMLEAGLDTLRIAEFAWAKFEPSEGEFNIGYFDEFLDLCENLGMNVIFGTPTAAPPIWLQRDYPEILNRDRQGHAIEGPRRNYTYNSPAYLKFSDRINEKLAEHYGKHPAIVGWQLDNEPNCEIAEFFSEGDHDAFREYLRGKYETLDNLNEKLGMTFWSQSYSNWDHVRLGGSGLYGSVNPHLELEERRFFSDSAIRFLERQIKILRRHIPEDVYITTNGLFPNLDWNALIEAGLDFITFDSYPNFVNDVEHGRGVESGELDADDLRDRKWSWNHSWTRSISPTFGIMEQQSGPHGWTNRMMAPAPKPGQMRLWTMQSVAHGADMIMYFRWRTAPMGQEIYWHGVNDYSNRPNRRLEELGGIAKEWDKLKDLEGATYQARVAVLKHYDNEYDADFDDWHGRIARQGDDAWFKATQLSHTPCDFLYLGDSDLEDLQKYDVLVYPHAAIMTDAQSDLLRRYVENGGNLVFGARTGYKDETGLCPMHELPGLVSEWIGVEVDQYTLVANDQPDMSVRWDDERYGAPIFSELLQPTDDETEVVATFDDDYYAGSPAVVRRKRGEGQVLYVGSGFSEQLAEKILDVLDVKAPYSAVVDVPESMELAVRKNDEGTWMFVLNYLSSPGTIELKQSVADAVTGETVEGKVELPGYGVGIYKI